ncbi:MAG: TRAP transporter large permease [Pararhodobacter sp.]|nr:TRAP transporter large permease [Pararhodobacter sp.]
MSGMTLGLIGFAALLLLMAARIPIALSMLLVGLVGSFSMIGVNGTLHGLNEAAYYRFSSYSLTIIPLFLLMSQFAVHAGLSTSLFKAARAWLGHRRGGLAVATVGACGGFGAISGSSLATAATMTQVALPEMRKAGYAPGLATGVLAAGGTLGILIPPSVVLVVYAVLANQNIVKLFTAAIVPGIIAILGYMAAVAIYVRIYPDSAPVQPKEPMRARLATLLEIWPVVVIFALVIGGIYSGIFTPTEGAAVGALGTGLVALLRGNLTRDALRDAFLGTATGTGMIFMIVLGAGVFNTFLALTQVPQSAAAWVGGLPVNPWLIIGIILLVYIVLGCVMDTLSMILLTVPIFFPIVMALDLGMTPEEVGLWFGILVLIVVEMGMITPPVGLNLFIINSMARDIRMSETMKGVLPFLITDVLRALLLFAFPPIILWLVWVAH